jgi:hypothetical protein
MRAEQAATTEHKRSSHYRYGRSWLRVTVRSVMPSSCRTPCLTQGGPRHGALTGPVTPARAPRWCSGGHSQSGMLPCWPRTCLASAITYIQPGLPGLGGLDHPSITPSTRPLAGRPPSRSCSDASSASTQCRSSGRGGERPPVRSARRRPLPSRSSRAARRAPASSDLGPSLCSAAVGLLVAGVTEHRASAKACSSLAPGAPRRPTPGQPQASSRGRRRAPRAAPRRSRTSARTWPPFPPMSRRGSRRAAAGCSRSRRPSGRRACRASSPRWAPSAGAARGRARRAGR